MDKTFLKIMQKKVAISAIGPSTIRNMGKNVIKKTRDSLTDLDLNKFSTKNKAKFKKRLNTETNKLKNKLPQKARRWGVARKSINLFLRDAFYNRYLFKHFKLGRVEHFLEIPLDSIVAKTLRKDIQTLEEILRRDFRLDAEETKKHEELKKKVRWRGLKNLHSKDSTKYQNFALTLADKCNMARIHLDMYLWLKTK